MTINQFRTSPVVTNQLRAGILLHVSSLIGSLIQSHVGFQQCGGEVAR
jgi:hypothetical protein